MKAHFSGSPHAVMWEGLAEQSLEYAELRCGESAIELAGMMLAVDDGVPMQVNYRIGCDSKWLTRDVVVSVCRNGSHAELQLEHDGMGNWVRDGVEDVHLRGCIHVDLEASPSTNVLPIRRIDFAVGARREMRCAWVRIPSLRVEPAMQTYERLTANDYEYSDRSGASRAMIRVDAQGLPNTYGSLWSRVCF